MNRRLFQSPIKYLYNQRFGRELVNFFDHIYCINLDSRPDRWRYVNRHFSKYGLKGKVERFSAIDVRKDLELQKHEKLLQENFSLLAMCGCMLSHRMIIEDAKSKKFKNILVFEDDIRILENNILGLKKSLNELDKQEWDIFYLGATYLFPFAKKGENLVTVLNGAYATHAISYNNTVYDKILELLPSNPVDFLSCNEFDINAIDKWLQSDFFDHSKFYGTNPIMVVQGLQDSDIACNQKEGIEQIQINLFKSHIQSCHDVEDAKN